MNQNHFRNSITIKAPLSDVYAYLTEFQNMIHLHPLIVEIRELPSTDSRKHILEIKDKIPLFGRFSIYKTYQASVETLPVQSTIIMETFTFPNIHIKNILHLKQDENHTIVNEDSLVEAPRYLTSFVMKQVTESHSHMLTELKRILETPQVSNK
ncbi:SRPBCC family protein [Shimazuella kribbensis]|uniref:SRPBCC family protein n=1 Tax=Shimazuella kribbensis TaxID=139808 RepID=UPI00048B2846|nr:SRPBCC family protein [Shimazuella kribbensis]